MKGVGPEPLKIESVKLSGGNIVLQFKTVAGEQYQLEHATALDPSDWQTAGGVVTATGATTRWTSTAPAGTHFYRARRVLR